jgi:hypothetical protein
MGAEAAGGRSSPSRSIRAREDGRGTMAMGLSRVTLIRMPDVGSVAHRSSSIGLRMTGGYFLTHHWAHLGPSIGARTAGVGAL